MNDLEKPPPELAKAYSNQIIFQRMFIILLASKPSSKLLTYTQSRQWDKFRAPFFHPIPETNTLCRYKTMKQLDESLLRSVRITAKLQLREAMGFHYPYCKLRVTPSA